MSVPTIFTLAYLILGIDEIGIQIEEPFATLPLTPLCATIERDMSIVIADIFASDDADRVARDVVARDGGAR
jgi:predicted membrane chloride channel (bestrophin family)